MTRFRVHNAHEAAMRARAYWMNRMRAFFDTVRTAQVQLARIRRETELRILSASQATGNFGMPAIPEPSDARAPNEPGIYFFWSSGNVVYVGQSRQLNRRINKRHHARRPGDLVSFLMFPVADLIYAECFYVWLARPVRNGLTPAQVSERVTSPAAYMKRYTRSPQQLSRAS